MTSPYPVFDSEQDFPWLRPSMLTDIGALGHFLTRLALAYFALILIRQNG